MTEETRAVLARRTEAVVQMFEGRATYEDVLRFHAEDFVWLSSAGVRVGQEEAMSHHSTRMAHIPPEALTGIRIIRNEVFGEYGFMMFKTDALPLGTDTYRVVDGKVVFQSNALYLPSRYRPAG